MCVVYGWYWMDAKSCLHRQKLHKTVKALCSRVLLATGHIVEVELSFMLFSRRRRMYNLYQNWSDEYMRPGVRVPRIKFNVFSYHIRSLSWLSMRKIDGPDLIYFHIVLFCACLAHYDRCGFELSHTPFVLGWRFHADMLRTWTFLSPLSIFNMNKRGISYQLSMQESAILTGNA